jgi:drug/metabolite transporter (DMT)-like permease
MTLLFNQWMALGLSAGLSVGIFLIFKWVANRKLFLPAVIVWNYLICVGLGSLFIYDTPIFTRSALQTPGFFPVISLGILFMITFLLMGRATAKSGAAMSAVSSKMSVVIPVILALGFFSEPISLWGVLGIGLALVAVFLITYQPQTETRLDRSLGWVFLGSGLVDSGLNAVKYADYAHWSNLQFAVLTFSGAALTGLMYLGSQKQISALWDRTAFLWGSLLGVVNLFSIFAIYNGIDAFPKKTAVFFTLNNISVVALTFVLGLILGERFSQRSLIGLSLAVLAIFLLG